MTRCACTFSAFDSFPRPRTTYRDCEHYFFVLEGNGVLHVNEETRDLGAGDVALVEKDEVHWFENHGPDNFVFIELWVPAPSDTVWVDPDDI